MPIWLTCMVLHGTRLHVRIGNNKMEADLVASVCAAKLDVVVHLPYKS